MTTTTTIYTIEGMTCGHCAGAVTSAIGALDGVSHVEVDLDAGTATVTSEGEIDRDTVKAAVADAGFEAA